MKKSFVYSFSFAAILFLAGYFTEYTRFIGSISLGIAIIFLVIGSLVSGAFVDGDQMRANLATESKEDRQMRHRVLFNSGIAAVPLFIAGGILLSI
ncbi:DUF5316 domain-containing protein [Virgibacillus necropolis]|uniref:DUF5316 family protein n=1 Tax=Virgibacillus necropolis TaxID=163877 RepID=UPI003850C96E